MKIVICFGCGIGGACDESSTDDLCPACTQDREISLAEDIL